MILQLETATTNCSVSLSSEGETLVFKEDYGSKYSHAERLHVYIDEVVKKAGIKLSELGAVAVSKGPGSYTGLRIGVSAAKGLCYALDIPLIAIPTLQSLASQVQEESGLIIPMIDARRMEVYSAVYNMDCSEIRETKAEILDKNSFSNYLEQGTIHFIGDGVKKASEIINHENARFIHDKLPSANNLSRFSHECFKEKRFEDIAYFEPYYLKDFIALKPKS
ncbi:MAG: tRNA (adenosine(37)-N6)-threonylcarbamoyltransferase complex dimerization subunit type 1 TsaB [Bacteroidia bacterium]|nr:tRNA (adenosine(37)-N6)-threonylcarbamoyltransferase complex dimerization subunit type 1 TsaB [Bacteroidia bacterium]MBT8270221.1 tRNA (adenosine(37)-N6)-threonylcarbamoyltransferase complex dimerization subunit type 1 TsaB [Bacteroidia bacterium]NNF82548.1 tRNA (adenosine(37)-N6)-threonylcarbamoyltransferase complex dimerization subunit type 1 TsaB [Flavobacteriaceae bacterium]NNK71066.1 tRNA (adenosine(37)-N6)-threonylcarbamoyltransferase complex dimerization subunit type 1 TsaB [Flavobacte